MGKLRTASALALVMSAALVLPTTASANNGSQLVKVKAGESIQAAIDAAQPGTRIVVEGDHAEQIRIDKNGIELIGRRGATIAPPAVEDRVVNICSEFGEFGPVAERPSTVCIASPTAIEVLAEGREPVPSDFVKGVTIQGIDFVDAAHDAIQALLVKDITIKRNTMIGTGCDGMFVLFADGFDITRNEVLGSERCNGISVAASSDGSVSRNTANDAFTGINLDDVSNVVASRNSATGNCIGIVAFDSPGPQSSSNVTINRNTANANNTPCFPFGPDLPFGGTGILVSGVAGATVSRNVANDNVVETNGFTVAAGGIFIGDAPDFFNPDPDAPPAALATDIRLTRNEAFGNGPDGAQVDINIGATEPLERVARNLCGTSFPDQSVCSGSH